MINFDPIHYAAVGLGVVCVGMGIYIKILSSELEVEKIANQATKVIGNVQNAHAKEEDKESKESKVGAEKLYADIIVRDTATIKRLRNQIARSSRLPTTPQVCTSATETATIDWPLISGAINDYRSEVAELIREGSEAQAALNAGKLWIEKETR